MNPDSKQPDYSFITEQPSLEVKNQPKNTKLIVLGAAVLVLLLVSIVVTVANKTSNSVKKQSTSTNKIENSIATQHLGLVTAGKIDESLDLFTDKTTQKMDFYNKTWQELNEYYNLSNCIESKTPPTYKDLKTVEIVCLNKKNDRAISIVYYFSDERAENLINIDWKPGVF